MKTLHRLRTLTRLAVLVVCGGVVSMGLATPSFAQTNTPTATNTPTQTAVPRVGKSDTAAWVHQSVRVDPGSLNLGGSEEVVVTVKGIQIGDPVMVYVPASFEAALIHSGTRVLANNKLAIRITSTVNSTNGAARDWEVIWFDRTQLIETPGPAPTVTNTP